MASGPLGPGTYVFESFDPPLRITLGEGWEAFAFGGPAKNETALGEFEDRPIVYDASEIARAGVFISIGTDATSIATPTPTRIDI